jgi:hypothetical protein
MKLFPGLFYIACILLLGIRLRPLHHHHHSVSAPITNAVWWQRELNLCVGLGWLYKRSSAFIARLCQKQVHTTTICTFSTVVADADSGYDDGCYTPYLLWSRWWRRCPIDIGERLKSVGVWEWVEGVVCWVYYHLWVPVAAAVLDLDLDFDFGWVAGVKLSSFAVDQMRDVMVSVCF